MVAVSLLLAGCGGPAKRTVVIEDRPVGKMASPAGSAGSRPSGGEAAGAATSPVVSSTDNSSNAGKPGFYSVKPGDTLVRIGLDHGQNWRDIARWNQIENPNVIEVGQVLRVRPEAGSARPLLRQPDRVERTLAGSSSAAGAPSAGGSAGAPGGVLATAAGSAPAGSAAPSNRTNAAAAPSGLGGEAAREQSAESANPDVNWAWPASGPVLQGFDEQRNKGLDIGGKVGDAVLAAAEGRVVYAGSALRGYGNLVILKHNGTFLSAYAHNQTLLVKEDQVVKRGQRIAEMGSTDAERVQLHFEIRRDGKPVDPARYLPTR
jgi:lipoprotein NlpD